MAKSGDWGGDKGAIKGTVKRTANVTKNATVTRAETRDIPGEAPKIRYVSEPWYVKEPLDPDYKRDKAVDLGG
jgi:hypothetical protein